MRLNKKMLHLIVVVASIFSWLHEATAATASVAKLGCREKCGNLTIPYPFGIGEACSLNEAFNVSCNETTKSATLSWFSYEVYKIENDSVGVESPVVVFEYNRSSGQSLYNGSIADDIVTEYYSYSPTKNKFVAVGCDIFAYITDYNTGKYVTGCPSLCNDPKFSSNSSSSCEANFSKELSDNRYWVHTMNTEARSWAFGQCGFSSVVAKDYYGYNKFNLSSCDSYRAPTVLDWAVGNMSCRDAVRNENYTCGQNSTCIDSARRLGYLCKCLPGYRGNPYLHNGCRDIDECRSSDTKCPKKSSCFNTPGSYICLCSSGYHSDGSNPRWPVCLPDRGKETMVMFVSLGVGLTVGLLILVASCLWLRKKMKERLRNKRRKFYFKQNGGLLLEQKVSSANGNVSETKVYTSEELEKATDNFSETRVLGKGGLGTVYKGMLSDGSIVAVKKSNKIDEHQVSQFINEVLILSQISHRHIVKLFGCCLETEVPLLVYEYVSNGTLSNHLHDDNTNAPTISWENRIRIAAEVAGALAYLHSYASTAIFHRDIKSSNILLDENYRAVVSDFGLSRSVSIDKTHLTTVVGGTFGYLDPEYFCTGQLNDKSDVYAFGVVLAELLTGKRAIPSWASGEGLVVQFRSSIKKNRFFELVDSTVLNEGQKEEIVSVANLALRCLKVNARKRPCMKEVAAELEEVRRLREGSMSKASFPDDCEYYSSSSDDQKSDTCTIDMVTEDSQSFT